MSADESGALAHQSAPECAHAASISMEAPSGGVRIVMCTECAGWRIILASGEGAGDLMRAMDDVGERLVGSARVELLELAVGMRQRGW